MLAQQFMSYKNWVVVGDVANSEKYAFKIFNALKSKGYNVKGINPRKGSEEVLTDLNLVEYDVDVIDLCINPKEGIKILEVAKKLNIKKVLIQPGAESLEILEYCKNNDIIAIEGCALVQLSNMGV
jgi:predicted CoA-binding protein